MILPGQLLRSRTMTRDMIWAGRKGLILNLVIFCLICPAWTVLSVAQTSDYIIGSQDVLEIKVYEQPDLDQTVRVSEEGRINLSLVGEVSVAGSTVEELIKILTQRYREYIYHPQVSIFVKEYHSKEIYILGEVRNPGLYTLTGTSTLLEILSQAGGITETGGDTLSIISGGKGGETTTVSLTELLEGGSGERNVTVDNGDTIYVPRADYFFVFGEVNKPGSYKLEKGLNITVLKAITLSGGFTEKASKGRIKITRDEEGSHRTFKVSLDTEVLPHDIIIVPESFF
jgi:polysaccharide export outer membrane protein